jgi:sugar phosphate isomerase/epimerase
MALWALKGGRLLDRVEWLVRHGFQGVSFLRYIMDFKPGDREDAAAAIKEARLDVTYHINVSDKISREEKLDTLFVDAMMDDVVWWHRHTAGVFSCCADPVHRPGDNGESVFHLALNREVLERMYARLGELGIRVGIENAFGGGRTFCAIADIARFAELAPPGTGMLLDTGHANIHVRSDGNEGETDIGDFVERLPLDVLEVHLHDNGGTTDEHRPLGSGNLDLSALCRALRRNGFRGKFTIEVLADAPAGRYAADICDPRQTDSILASRDRICEAWAQRER